MKNMGEISKEAVEGVVVAYCREGMGEEGVRVVEGYGRDVGISGGVKGVLRRCCGWEGRGFGIGVEVGNGNEGSKKAMELELKIGEARSLAELEVLGRSVRRDEDVDWYVGLMTGLVGGFLDKGGKRGGILGKEYFVEWVKRNVVDGRSGKMKESFGKDKGAVGSVMATASKVLGANAMDSPRECLKLYDWLSEVGLPGFRRSLPLQTVQFLLLKYVGLPLENTLRRIRLARGRMLQFDEQAFSMAIAAILNSDGSRVEKLRAAQGVERMMRAAGVAKTVQTYSAYAKELRDHNDAMTAIHLLTDMEKEEVTPTAKTYSLLFHSFVTSGLFNYRKRFQTADPPILIEGLQTVVESMRDHKVSHSHQSSLSLAMACAHLGLDYEALDTFHYHLSLLPSSDHSKSFTQMIHTAAHARIPSSLPFTIFEKFRRRRLMASHLHLNALITASYRTLSSDQLTKTVQYFSRVSPEFFPTLSAFSHLFDTIAIGADPELWHNIRTSVEKYISIGKTRPHEAAIKRAVISFYGIDRLDICEDILRVTAIHPVDWAAYGLIGKIHLNGGELDERKRELRGEIEESGAAHQNTATGAGMGPLRASQAFEVVSPPVLSPM